MAHSRSTAAFTRKELLVVLAVLLVLGLLLIPGFQAASQKSKSITCNGRLKCLGLAYRIWANDNGDRFPASAPLTSGGWSYLLSRPNAGTYAWTNYEIMAEDMGQSPLIVVCPADERKPANSFSNLSNLNCSYFVGVSANETYPQSILGGDRNLGPGITPDPEYGFSPTNGKGNDVTINGPVCWSLKMHSRGIPAGAGNIILGDGSAQQVSTENLNRNWLTNAFTRNAALDKATNSSGMRLIFP
jgi:competence protein ComGC